MKSTKFKELEKQLEQILLNKLADETKETSVSTAKSENPFKNRDTEIVKQGTKIILPNDPREMTEDEAIEQLMRKKEQAEMDVSIHEEIDCFPLEGAYALMKCLEAKYGWVNSVPTPGFFGPQPPTMVTLQTAYGEYTQVIWGDFQVPGVKGRIKTSAMHKQNQPIFVISGVVRKKHQEEIKQLANMVREFVKSNSLYKGKAIKLVTEKDGDSYSVDMNNPPEFINLLRVNEAELVFSDDVMYQIDTNLFTPIEKTELCREHRVPLKRGVLLEGPYGTGKTLTAFVAAKKAVANGWTFIYLDRVTAIKEALLFARRYAPAVIFAEDIERVVSGGRNVSVDDVLNNIDGIDSKNQEILTVFTTNHVEKIERAMLRPGRLDAVITVNPPNAQAAEKLIRVYAKELISAEENLAPAGKELTGQIPAVIREVVERSKLFAISRLKTGDQLTLTGQDIARAAIGMKSHLALLNPKSVPPKTQGEMLADTLGNIVADKLTNSNELGRLTEVVEEIKENMN